MEYRFFANRFRLVKSLKGDNLMSTTREEKKLAQITIEELMIPSEKVAHVQLNNPLEHALLVLTGSGYFAVPVLDNENKLAGSISKTVILDQILGIERYEVEKLSHLQVSDVMDQDVARIEKNKFFIDGLKSVINAPFVCVIDGAEHFEGILTRRAILKMVQREYYQRQFGS